MITAIWTASMVADFFLPNYDPNATIHATMMAVVAFLFGPAILRRNGNGA